MVTPEELAEIKIALGEYAQCPKGLNNTYIMADYASEIIPFLITECERLRDGIAAIETRWRDASQDSGSRTFRDTMAECAAELAVLLAGMDDKELQAEIDKAMEE